MSLEAASEHSELDRAIGERVYMLMFRQHVTQVALGRALGLNQAGIARRLRGETSWKSTDLAATSRTLNTSIAYLVGEDDTPPAPLPRGGSVVPGMVTLVGPMGLEPMTRGLKGLRFAGKPHHLHIAPLIPIEAAPRFRELVSAS